MGKTLPPHERAARYLSPPGKELYESVTAARDLDAAGRALLLQACRLVDRLDKLDGIIRSPRTAWLTLIEDAEDPSRSVVVVDAVLGEFRQQSLALATLFGRLGIGQLGNPRAVPDGNDDLGKRRADRIAAAKASARPG